MKIGDTLFLVVDVDHHRDDVYVRIGEEGDSVRVEKVKIER